MKFVTHTNNLYIDIDKKLFLFFIKKCNPLNIDGFADRRWVSLLKPTIYDKLGLKKTEIIKPNYDYTLRNKRVNKNNTTKQILSEKYSLPLAMTKREMCLKLQFYRIYNCGLIKYTWNRD